MWFLSFVVVIFNDSKYGVIEWKQMNHFNRATHIDFTNPDFVKYAESFGIKGKRVEGSDELLPSLEKAMKDESISLIDVPVDSGENLKLSEMLSKKACPV